MNAATAASLVGGSRHVMHNMALALSLHAWNNTPEENRRLEAARWALANWAAFSREKQARLEQRNRRRS